MSVSDNGIFTRSWVAIDTETTGLNPWKHELLEIGAARFDLSGSVSDKFEILIIPENKQDPRSREVHNISNEELNEKGTSLQNALECFFAFLNPDDNLVFHNAPFDMGFLKRSAEKVKLTIPELLYYDHLYLSRQYMKQRKSHSLAAIRKDLELNTGSEHRALSDALATAYAFINLIEENSDRLQSKKKQHSFFRYHRKTSQFKVKVPRNLDKIQGYIDRKIRSKELIKLEVFENRNRSIQMVTPIELMIFNQKPMLKARILASGDEKLFPLDSANILDSDIGRAF